MGIHISVYQKGKTHGNGNVSFLNVTQKMPFNPNMLFGHQSFANDVHEFGQCVQFENYRIGGLVCRPTNFAAIRDNWSDESDPKLKDLLSAVEEDETLFFDFE